jgi:hypothetical protein
VVASMIEKDLISSKPEENLDERLKNTTFSKQNCYDYISKMTLTGGKIIDNNNIKQVLSCNFIHKTLILLRL